MTATMTIAARFAAKVRVDPETGCHVWAGGKQSSGYGAFKFGEHMGLAHRYAWEVVHGAIPLDKEIDHTCRNKVCVNVAHLEVVEHHENMRRAKPYRPPPHNSLKERCPRCGSEFTVVPPWRGGKPKRHCEPCGAANARKRYQEGGVEARLANARRMREYRVKLRAKGLVLRGGRVAPRKRGL